MAGGGPSRWRHGWGGVARAVKAFRVLSQIGKYLGLKRHTVCYTLAIVSQHPHLVAVELGVGAVT